MTTYSTLLWQGACTTGVQTVYTVPAQTVVVVRDVEWYSSSTTTGSLYCVSVVPGFSNALFAGAPPAAGEWLHQWQGRHVMPAASKIELGGFGTGVLVAISGYVLTG